MPRHAPTVHEAAVILSLVAVLATAAAHAEPVERGVDHALAIHVPPQGLRRLGDAVEAIVPSAFPILESTGTFECSDGQALDYRLAAFDVRLTADDVAIETSTDHLDLTLYATLDSTPTTLTAVGDCAILEDLDETCALQLPITAVEVGLSVDVTTTADGLVDATVAPVDLFISPIGNPVQGCTLASAIGTALGQNPDLIDDLVTGAILPALEEVPAQVEEAIEGALNSFAADTTIDLLGTELDLLLATERIGFTSDGLLVGLSADLAADVAPSCVDLGALPAPPETAWPAFAETAPGTSLHHDAGVLIGRAFVQELLTTSWATGVLCQEIEEFSGARIRGGTINAFFGGAVTEIVDEDAPAKVVLNSAAPPEVSFDEDQPVVRIGLDTLSVDLIAELDHRQTRLAEIGIDAVAGLDLGIEDRILAPTLAIDPATFRFEERYSELLPPGYSSGLGDMLDIVLGGLLPTEALASVTIPTPLGIDLEEPFWIPSPDGEWQGLFLRLDLTQVQSIPVQGCTADVLGCGDGGGGIEFDLDAALGCDDPAAGCDDGSGCVSLGVVHVPARPLLATLLVPFLLRRRRQPAR